MPEEARVTFEQVQAAAARAGVTVGEELEMLVPLLAQIMAALDAVPNDRLQDVEPLLTHEARKRGPA